MNRGLWFVAGAGAGIYAVIRGRRAAEALTIDGLQDRLNGLAVGARMFRDEVAQGKAEKKPSCASGSRSRLMATRNSNEDRKRRAGADGHR